MTSVEYKASVTRGKNGRGHPKCVVTEHGDNGFSTSRFVCEAANIEYAEMIADALNAAQDSTPADYRGCHLEPNA